MRVFITLLLGLFILKAGYAHVGSPEVVMEGNAGPYKLLVSVRPPDVIPGVAGVRVYLENASEANISLRAVYFRSGDEGAPEPDVMKKVTGNSSEYNGETWLMSGGSSSVQITISGALGKGEMVVPVVAVSTAKKEMPSSTGALLAVLGILLFILMVTIIGASVSDALTKRGEDVPVNRKRNRWAGVGISAVLTLLIVFGGNAWWKSWAADYTRYMFKPTQAVSEIRSVEGANELTLRLDSNSQRASSFPYLVLDHGKMMHMFIMRMPAMDAFAHLHPERSDTTTFKTYLPPLPAGRYLAFADVVYMSGYSETIKDTFEISAPLTDSAHRMDKDDAYAFALPADVVDNPQLTNANTIICGKPGTGVKLKDGSTMVWEGMTNEPLESGQLYRMRFSLLSPDKKPATLEPYLGMGGHAAVVRSDGNVYVHLHPVGTYSMAAEKSLVERISEPQGVYEYPNAKTFRDSVNRQFRYLAALPDTERQKVLMAGMDSPLHKSNSMMGMTHNNEVEFPYSFPSPGKYRIWVQVKRNGQVLTGAFDKMVN